MDTKEIIFDLMDDYTNGVDTYNHNGSTWLIFTDSKKWVIELTKEKTLWYNYYFFTGVFKYLSLDVVENQHYITKWVEDTVINGVKSTKGEYYKEIQKVEYTIENGVKYTIDIEDAIQNGVKKTRRNGDSMNTEAEDVIQNGVKDTFDFAVNPLDLIEDTIQNGVKETISTKHPFGGRVEDTIENGVKQTKRSYEGSRKQRTKDTIKNGVKKTYSDKIPHEYDWTNQFTEEIGNVIKNGVKHTEYGDWEDGDERLDDIIKNGIKETESIASHRTWKSEEVIQNGIKETNPHFLEIINPMNFEPNIQEMKRLNEVNEIIQNGVKETIELPDKSGELMGYGEYYARQKDRTYPHNDIVSDVIREGIKETVTGSDKRMLVENVLNNGVKLT